jgi:hypothetical protein
LLPVLCAFQPFWRRQSHGKAHSMTQLLALTPVQKVSREKMEVTGVGYEANEQEGVEGPAAYAKSLNLGFSRGPIPVDLQLTQIIQFGKLKTVIQGFQPVQRPQHVDKAIRSNLSASTFPTQCM